MWIERIFKFREKSDTEETKPFLEHLEDLRWMLARMGGTVALAMILSFCFRHQLADVIERPLFHINPNARLTTLAPMDAFNTSIQLSFYAGIILSFPMLLYFLAQFVLPALTLKEKKYVLPGICVGFGLFLTGVLVSYFLILPRALEWFQSDTHSFHWEAGWTVPLYFSFVTRITLVFGLAFELPVAVIALVHIGILSFEFLNRTRSYAIVLVLILAMIIAPSPDPLTFFSLGGPMILLYEACIWLAWMMERRRKQE